MKKIQDRIDWVELGCLGWDIDETGAGMDCDWQEGPEFRCHEGDYAHIDRETCELLLCGCPEFVATVVNHLLYSQFLYVGGPLLQSYLVYRGSMTVPLSGTCTSSTTEWA